MAFPRHYQTPEHDDYKIARFAQLGLMPTAMKSDPFFPAMNWNGASGGVMEIDSSRRDRLSNSAQKKFRRWSRRLNGQHANGSGWVMRHDYSRRTPSWGRDQAYSPACEDYRRSASRLHGDERFSSERLAHTWRGEQRGTGGPGRDHGRRRARSQGPPSFPRSAEQEPLPYFCDVAVSPSPRRERFLRSERRLFKARRPHHDDEPLATTLPPQPDEPTEHFAITAVRTRGSPLKDSRAPSPAKRPDSQLHPHRSRQSERLESRGFDAIQSGNQSCARGDNETEAETATEEKTSFYRRAGCQVEENDSGQGREEMTITADATVIVKELRGRRIESPCKATPATPNHAPVNICLPLDANTFFGTKEKSRSFTASSLSKPRRPSVDLGAPRGDTSRRLSIETNVPNPCSNVPQEINRTSTETHNKPKSIAAHRRRSSQDSDISIIAVITPTDKRQKPIGETPRSSAPKSAKKSMDRAQCPITPSSSEGPTGAHRRRSTEAVQTEQATHGKPPRRSSPTGDLKPKAIIKPGLRSAKKDSSKTTAPKTERRRSSPTKNVTAGQTPRRLVQKTLDSFFSKGGSASSQTQQPAKPSTSNEGGKNERLRSAKKISVDAQSAVAEQTRGHIRRIYQDDEPKIKLPVVSLTPLAVEMRAQSLPERTGPASSATSRLAHVMPIPSPAKKRPCEDTSSPPRKISRRSSAESSDSIDKSDTRKYDTVRDVSPSCPLKKVFSVSKVSDKTDAQDLRRDTRGSCSKRSKDRSSASAEKSAQEGRPSPSKSCELRDFKESEGSSQKSSSERVPSKEEITSNKTTCSKENKRSSPRKLSKKRQKWKRSPSKKSILGPSDLSYLFKQAYLASKSEEDSTQDRDAEKPELKHTSSSSTPSVALPVKDNQDSVPIAKSPTKSEKFSSNNLESSSNLSSQDENVCPSPKHNASMELCVTEILCRNVLQVQVRDMSSGRFVSKAALMDQGTTVAPAPAQPSKAATSPASSLMRLRRSPTRASDCGSPAKLPSSGSKTRTASAADALCSASPRTSRVPALSPGKQDARAPEASSAQPRSPSKRVELAADLVVTQPEEELLQAQLDRAEQAAEAVKAAQRNKQRHTRGRRVYEYCPALDEHLERHPVQNEMSADKWYKWLNPSQLRCLTLAMLDNQDLCLRYTMDAPRVEPWEAAWVDISRRLNTVCYNRLTNLNTGLRLTVMEWKKLWLDMRSLIRTRVEAMEPKQRRHGLGSLECLLYSEKLYAALIKSNGECLGEECPRVWCSGACVGVFCPTLETANRRKTEE